MWAIFIYMLHFQFLNLVTAFAFLNISRHVIIFADFVVMVNFRRQFPKILR